jgi:hypothetical protein
MGPPPPELAGYLEPHHVDRFDPMGAMHPDFEKAWDEEIEQDQRMRGLPPRALMRGPPPPHEQWATEFRSREAPPPPWVQDFHAQHMPQDEMVREYEEMMREEEAREFDQLDRAYHDATDGPEVKQWVDEFEKMKGGEFVEDEEEEQWYSDFRNKEQQRKEQSREALSELSRKISTITDPRLRQSNFMKFLGKLGSGELVVQGDRVVEGQQGPAGEQSWASEFHQQEAPNDWAREFDTMHAPPPPAGWAEEFARSGERQEGEWAEEFERREADAWAEEFRRTEGSPAAENEEWVRKFQELNMDGMPRDYDAAW